MSDENKINISDETITQVLNEPATQELLKNTLRDAITKSIAESFRYGEINRAIDKKIKEVLVPAIENYDLSAYIPKLETILMEIINTTDLNTNKIILENFKELMTEPESKTITLEQIFKKYCKYMAENVDTTNLEVNLDDGPHYESFECYCETENVSSEYSHYERYNVTFRCDDTVDDDDNKIFSIHLSRWKSNPEPKYDITIEKELNIDSLRYLNDFNVYLLKLARANIKITGLEDITEDVEPEAEPEASWS